MVSHASRDGKLFAINRWNSWVSLLSVFHLRMNLISKSPVLPSWGILTSRCGHCGSGHTVICKLNWVPALKLEFSFFTVICVALVSKVMHLSPLTFHLNSGLSHCDIINNLEKYWGMDLNLSVFMKLLYLLIKFQAQNKTTWRDGSEQVQKPEREHTWNTFGLGQMHLQSCQGGIINEKGAFYGFSFMSSNFLFQNSVLQKSLGNSSQLYRFGGCPSEEARFWPASGDPWGGRKMYGC